MYGYVWNQGIAIRRKTISSFIIIMRISTKIVDSRAGIKPIGPITPNWAPRLLLVVQVHTSTRCRFYREQQLDSTPPKTGPDRRNQLSHMFPLVQLFLGIFFYLKPKYLETLDCNTMGMLHWLLCRHDSKHHMFYKMSVVGIALCLRLVLGAEWLY